MTLLVPSLCLLFLLQPATIPATNPTTTLSSPAPLDLLPLAQSQLANGSWENSPRLTALTTLTFLSAGHPPANGRYGRVVSRASVYLRDSASKPDPLVLLALANLAALDQSQETRAAASAMATSLLSPTTLAEAAWQAMALKAARGSGIPIPSDALLRLDAYLVSTRSRPGAFASAPGKPPSPDANATALVLLHTLGYADSPEMAIVAGRLPAATAANDPESAIQGGLARHFASLPPAYSPSLPLPYRLLLQSLPSSPIPAFQR